MRVKVMVLGWAFSLVATWGQTAPTLRQTQSENPVLLQIDGKNIARAEFEYAYRKNKDTAGATAVDLATYLDMFVNYKLKVAYAQRLRLDTLSAFQTEYQQQYEAQVKDLLLDQHFIDSVAQTVYQRQQQRMGGKPILKVSHILLKLSQHATEAERQKQAQRADSIYQAIVGGADFAQMAAQYSDDESSAVQGGKLRDIYPGLTVKAFEDQVYALGVGEFSRPFLTEFGYHIAWVHERKALGSYETLYPQILAALKKQNIEEFSAQNRLEQYMRQGQRSKAQVIDSLMQIRLNEEPDLQYLLQEYYDGLLLYEAYQREVLLPSKQNTAALATLFQKNKKQYRWDLPHFKGYIVGAKNEKVAQQAVKMMNKQLPENGKWEDLFKDNLNKDSMQVYALGLYLVAQGENSTIDNLVFGDRGAVVKKVRPEYPITMTAGKKLKQAESYKDVQSSVESDYVEQLNQAWTARLRREIPYTIYPNIFKQIKP